MGSVFGRPRLVVNPQAGNGAGARNLPELTNALTDHGVDFDVAETTRPGDATRLAREALDAGQRYVVAVGGDGTVQEVLNGLFDGQTPVDEEAVLGVAAAGSGCDFSRTFGLDRSPEIVARHLASESFMPIDVGVVAYTGFDGNPATRLFANIAEVGYGAEVVRRAGRYPRWFGRFRYLVGAYGAIRGLTRQEATVAVARTEKTVPVVNLVVANGQFFGGGMKVAPRALPDDGRFNVQIFHGQRSQLFMMTTKIYRGEHLPHPDITEYNSERVTFAPGDPMLIEADGELLGTTPATFTLLPRAVRLKV